jgi:hypothetical protein
MCGAVSQHRGLGQCYRLVLAISAAVAALVAVEVVVFCVGVKLCLSPQGIT